MEIFLIVLAVIGASIILTLLASCIVHWTLNPFRYFHEDWAEGNIQMAVSLNILFLGLIAFAIYSVYREEQLHRIETEWDESSGCYNITVSSAEVKGINILYKNSD